MYSGQWGSFIVKDCFWASPKFKPDECYCHIAYTVQLLAVSCFIIVDHEFSKQFYFIKFVVSDLYCYIHIFLVYTNECETSTKNRSLICLPLFSLRNCVANFYCYFSTCIKSTTQVQYHIMFNIQIFFCYNEFFVKNIFSVHWDVLI